MNESAEGTTYPDATFVVDPDRVAAFRELFGIAGGVPPTFLTAAEFTVFPAVIEDPHLALDFTRVVHGSQEYRFERPIVEGETLTVRARIESIRRKGAHAFLVLAMDMVGADGLLAAVARNTLIERGDA